MISYRRLQQGQAYADFRKMPNTKCTLTSCHRPHPPAIEVIARPRCICSNTLCEKPLTYTFLTRVALDAKVLMSASFQMGHPRRAALVNE